MYQASLIGVAGGKNAGDASAADMPTTQLSADDLTGGQIGALDLLVKTGLVKSKSEARQVVKQGGLTINDAKVTDMFAMYGADAFGEDGMIIRKGKKTFHKVTL